MGVEVPLRANERFGAMAELTPATAKVLANSLRVISIRASFPEHWYVVKFGPALSRHQDPCDLTTVLSSRAFAFPNQATI